MRMQFRLEYCCCRSSDSFSASISFTFGLNTERYGVSQSKLGKIRTIKTPNTDTFHAVHLYRMPLSQVGQKDHLSTFPASFYQQTPVFYSTESYSKPSPGTFPIQKPRPYIFIYCLQCSVVKPYYQSFIG